MSDEQSIRDEIAEWDEVKQWANDLLSSPAIRRIQAEALRGATRAFATGGWIDTFTAGVVDDVTAVQATDRWFNEAADRIERGDSMTSREDLIEAAAKAMYRNNWGDEFTFEEDREHWVNQARTAFAVFEKAHTPTDDYPDAEGQSELRQETPTDDEREAAKAEAVVQFPSSSIARRGFITGWLKRAALCRTAVQEPSDDGHDGWCGCEKCEPEPQGNPATETASELEVPADAPTGAQGEPTDAQVGAMAEEIRRRVSGWVGATGLLSDVDFRAAARAVHSAAMRAAAAQEEEQEPDHTTNHEIRRQDHA